MKSNQGYTLIELAIVMTIIGLIAGGVFAAVSVIRSSELNTALQEYDSYIKGVNEFQTKFLALPGDMNNATDMWGADLAGCPGAYSATLKVNTCNGDGNGTVGSSDTAGGLSEQNEYFRFWQHLSNAGFIQGKFSGVRGPTSAGEAVPDVNVPRSRLRGSGWTAQFLILPSSLVLGDDIRSHIFYLGAAVTGDVTRGPGLTPEEAYMLDKKVDDGRPGYGIVRAPGSGTLANCTTGATVSAMAYNLAFTSAGCSVAFVANF